MNQRPDTDRLLRHWMSDGPSTMPDRVLDVVADRISRQPQHRTWRLIRRDAHVNTYAKLAAATAAVLVIGFVGWRLLPGFGGGPGTPTAIPTASPSAAATTSPSITIKPSTVTLRPIAGNPLGWQVSVPGGWTNDASWYLYPTALGTAGKVPSEPNGLSVSFLNVPEVVVDGCNFLGGMSDTSTLTELVATIRAKDDWVVSTPTDVTISGFSGQRLDVELPADLSRCGKDNYTVFGEPGTENGYYAQGPANQLRLWVLDVDGRIVILQRESFAATPAKELAEAQQIIESSMIAP